MTCSDFVGALTNQLTHLDAEFAVNAVLDAMGDTLIKGHRIEIRGFGSFSVNRRSPRAGRNPRFGESVMIPENQVPHFMHGKALCEHLDLPLVVAAVIGLQDLTGCSQPSD